MKTLAGAWLAAALAVTAAGAAAGDELESRVEEALRTPGFAAGHWGLLVVDGKTGQAVYERNADQLFCPASVTKLYTTAAALAALGPDFRFKTPVVRRGEVDKDGVLDGDLILVARGDLSLGGRTGPDGSLLFEDNDHSYAVGNLDATLVKADPLAGLDHLAREVRESGITQVDGQVIVDDRLFARGAESTGSGPKRLSPIVVNDNVVDVVVTPGAKPGEPATIRTVPASPFYAMDAQVETAPEGTAAEVTVRSAGPRRFSVRGQVPVGHRPVVKIYAVGEPADFARALFIEALRRRGVRTPRASSVGDNPADALPPRDQVAALPRVGEYTSPPFKEYVRVILKVSQNLHASTLPLLLAADDKKPATLAEGLRREEALLRRLGVDTATIAFGGGAGGDRSDLVTPRATVALLRAMEKRPEFPHFQASLPVLGRDGTLARAVDPESPARGHARAKTGTYWVDNGLNGKAVLTSKALAGYMETAAGRPLVFAFFLNNVPLDAPGDDVSAATNAAGRLLGTLCEIFYTADAPDPARPPKAAH